MEQTSSITSGLGVPAAPKAALPSAAFLCTIVGISALAGVAAALRDGMNPSITRYRIAWASFWMRYTASAVPTESW